MQRSNVKKNDSAGFTLVELLVVMGIFMTIMLITASSFKTIANSVSQQQKSAETQIEGIVGLEVLRADLIQTGFGLPWTYVNPPAAATYTESVLGNNMPASSYWQAGDPSTNFNDATAGVPRAIQSRDTTFNKDGANVGAKYIVIKSTVAGTGDAAKRWTNVSFANNVKAIRKWDDAARDFVSTDRVIVIRNTVGNGSAASADGTSATPSNVSRDLMVKTDGTFFTTFSNYSTLTLPHEEGDTFQIYGVASSDLRMPFNRADYYVMRPTKMPEGCAPGTGILYKSNIAHGSGGYSPVMPLLDCVADMQIVYGLDTSAAGTVNLHTSDISTLTAAQIRAQVKELRVYVLAQDGKIDRNYKNPSPTITVGETVGGNLWGRTFNLSTFIGTGWEKYRWKVYTIVVRPRNLIQ